MPNRVLRPLLIVEFLIAVQAAFTFWSQAGGQYHLDLMYWPWKVGLSIAAAGFIVAITANLARNDGAITRRALLYCSLRSSSSWWPVWLRITTTSTSPPTRMRSRTMNRRESAALCCNLPGGDSYMIEIEFLDEPDLHERWFRFGTDKGALPPKP
jgi:hypothetical protein